MIGLGHSNFPERKADSLYDEDFASVSTQFLWKKGQAFSVVGQTDSYAEASDCDCDNNTGTPSMSGLRLRNLPQLGSRCCLCSCSSFCMHIYSFKVEYL